MRRALAAVTVLVTVAACGNPAPTGVAAREATTPPATVEPPVATEIPRPAAAAVPDFAEVTQQIDDAIAARQLPGAVLVVGHGGHVVFHQA